LRTIHNVSLDIIAKIQARMKHERNPLAKKINNLHEEIQEIEEDQNSTTTPKLRKL